MRNVGSGKRVGRREQRGKSLLEEKMESVFLNRVQPPISSRPFSRIHNKTRNELSRVPTFG